MKQFTFSDMNRASGEVLEAALIEPVALTKHGKEKLVILTAATYKQMQEFSANIRAFSLEDAPDDIHAELMEGIDALLQDDVPGV